MLDRPSLVTESLAMTAWNPRTTGSDRVSAATSAPIALPTPQYLDNVGETAFLAVVPPASGSHAAPVQPEMWSSLFVLVLSTFIGLGVILRVSRLLHTPLMSLTNAISAIAVVGSILVTGGDFPIGYRVVGAIALAASTANIVSGFLITNRMLKMFKTERVEDKP